MITKIAEYSIKLGEEERVDRAIAKFVRAIAENEKSTQYKAYRKTGTREYIHIMSFVSKEDEERHASAEYTQEFVKELYPRCEKEPIFADLDNF